MFLWDWRRRQISASILEFDLLKPELPEIHWSEDTCCKIKELCIIVYYPTKIFNFWVTSHFRDLLKKIPISSLSSWSEIPLLSASLKDTSVFPNRHTWEGNRVKKLKYLSEREHRVGMVSVRFTGIHVIKTF